MDTLTLGISARSDRELLELAAKAAGLNVKFGENDYSYLADAPRQDYWNPLKDDGDALRLAVKLSTQAPFELLLHTGGSDANYLAVTKAQMAHGMDYSAAARRAIVRVAAAIGEKQ